MKSKYNKNNNNNKSQYNPKNNTINNYIASPGIQVTNPVDYIPLYAKPTSETIRFKIGGETPFSQGSVTNAKVNLYNAKTLSPETATIRTIPLYGTEFNIRGLTLIKTTASNTTTYTGNRAAILANENAQLLRQTLIAKQQYQLNFLTEYSSPSPSTNPFDPIFIMGLASNYIGVMASMLFTRIYRAAAYVGDAMDYDKERANYYMDLQAALQRRSFTTAVGALIGAFKSIYVDHDTVFSYNSLSGLEKNTKAYNTPYIWHDYSFSNPTFDALTIIRTFNGSSTTINLIDKALWLKYANNIFNMEHIDKLVNNVACKITDINGTEITLTGANDIRKYMDKMREYIEHLTTTLRATSTVFTSYYAVLTIVGDTGILSESFKPNFDLMKLIPHAQTVHRDFKLASLINLISVYAKLNPTIDPNSNTVNMLLPYYDDFQPFTGTDGNEILKYITIPSNTYAPFTNLSTTKIGYNRPTDSNNYLTLWASSTPQIVSGFYSGSNEWGRTAVKVENNNGTLIIGEAIQKGANPNYVYTVKSFGQYVAYYSLVGMSVQSSPAIWMNYVSGFINMSYLSIEPFVLNTASYAIGIKNANRLF